MWRQSLILGSRLGRASLLVGGLGGALALAVACAKSSEGGSGFPTSGTSSSGSGSGGASGASGSGSGVFSGTSGVLGGSGSLSGGLSGALANQNMGDAGPCDGGYCTDFPANPIMDSKSTGTIPSNAAMLFGAPSNGSTTDGPCMAEPANNALYPYNWLRPRVLWTPGTKAQTLFEVRFHADLEANDLVVYTTNSYWEMDKTIWQSIAGVEGGFPGPLVGQPITVTVRAMAGTSGTPTISNQAIIEIAPAVADGSLIYWTTASFDANAATTTLQGFHVGDEGTTTALTPTQVQQQVWAGPGDGGPFPTSNPVPQEPVACIGCHTATPDGNYVGFTAQWPWPNAIASVQADAGAPVGAAPPWLTRSAIDNLGPNTNDSNWDGPANKSGQYGLTVGSNNVDAVMLGIQAFSAAHYTTGDRIEVTTVGAAIDEPNPGMDLPTNVVTKLIWVNLEFTGLTDGGRPSALTGAPNNGGWGIIPTGDTNSQGAPSWSTDGMQIAYTSVNGGTEDGRLAAPASGSADVKIVPYGNKAGGKAVGLPGASDPNYNEYFPAFSPDGNLIAFNRVAAAQTMYNQPLAEVYVVPVNGGQGGTATRLIANDPVACTLNASGQHFVSPGVQNTWPKWAPDPAGSTPGTTVPQIINGIQYYWVTFSSTRSVTAAGKEQLYVAGITVDTNSGMVTTYGPIYLWNQSDTVNNLIPAWGAFSIPPGAQPPPPPPLPNPPK